MKLCVKCLQRDAELVCKLSVEPHLYFDLGPERWNSRRFGDAAGDPDYNTGFNAANFHLTFKWQLADGLSIYAGVRRFDALTHEMRRQTRGNAAFDIRENYWKRKIEAHRSLC